MAKRRVERRTDDEHAGIAAGDPRADRLEELRAADGLVRDDEHAVLLGRVTAPGLHERGGSRPCARNTHQTPAAESATKTATPSQTLITDPITISAK